MAPTTYKSLADYYDSSERYLFVGNGINQIARSSISWSGLLKNVCSSFKVKVEPGQKANPIFFEEMAFMLNPKQTVEENIRDLKRVIGGEALKLNPHPRCKELINAGLYNQYLTTNYDYCIERSIDPHHDPLEGKNSRRYPKYSLYRFNQVNRTKIWHIHGEAQSAYNGTVYNYPEMSILIGFEHYSDYLQRIHGQVKSGTGEGLAELIEEAKSKHKESWPHLFFTNDIDIIGFGMDISEAHLWFLLNFRARLKRNHAKIANKIRWIIPEFELPHQKCKDKAELLRALDVTVVPVKANAGDYDGFYAEFIINHFRY